MWTSASLILLLAFIPFAGFKFTTWYSQRCCDEAYAITSERLAHYQDIANTYTTDGTPEALQKVIEELEGLMDELQYIQENNPINKGE